MSGVTRLPMGHMARPAASRDGYAPVAAAAAMAQPSAPVSLTSTVSTGRPRMSANIFVHTPDLAAPPASRTQSGGVRRVASSFSR